MNNTFGAGQFTLKFNDSIVWGPLDLPARITRTSMRIKDPQNWGDSGLPAIDIWLLNQATALRATNEQARALLVLTDALLFVFIDAIRRLRCVQKVFVFVGVFGQGDGALCFVCRVFVSFFSSFFFLFFSHSVCSFVFFRKKVSLRQRT